jgi:NADH-quinone oxidoreductase subunit F
MSSTIGLEQLESIKNNYLLKSKKIEKNINICAGTGCIANGALKVFDEFEKQLKDKNIDVILSLSKSKILSDNSFFLIKSGCHGFCQMGPLVSIEPDGLLYIKVKPNDVVEIIENTIINSAVVDRLLYKDNNDKAYYNHHDIPFYALQTRNVLDKCGRIDAQDIDAYIAENGYIASFNAWTKMSNKDVINEVLRSGLRGRGGAGFPTGKKWDITNVQVNDTKYIICNADEGDPGAFMDRSILEGNPHSVIEGMLIAAKAIGATEGYIYVRTEYPLACKRIKDAIKEAEKLGLLSNNIFETGKGFKINVMEGAGAFVCGEETALIASIEGERGMPNPKPPFPAVNGLFGKPTCINNVETLSTVPLIIEKGADWFKNYGTGNSTGTKTFAVTGNIANTGLIEVPFGTTLREIVEHIAGGVLDRYNKVDMNAFKAVQIGGPSGGCLTKEHLELSLDYDSLMKNGAMVGSGGLVVMNDSTCMIKIARFFMQFTQGESCGKCVICREGTKQMLALLDDIIEGNATMETLDLLEELAYCVKDGSLCGLGKTAPNPILATMKYFRAEYEEHIINKRCPTKQCKALCEPEILDDKCIGCRMCMKMCPVGAISGELKKIHIIDVTKCIKCGGCKQVCKFNAVIGVN